MTDLERLQGWFADGTLLRPGGPGPDLVDFSRALASLGGVGGLELSPAARALKETIGPAEHYVLALIDGFGIEQLARCPEGGFLRSRAAGEIRSVFLATTAAALTSLYTGAYPAEHGVLAWWLRLAGHDLTATILPFTERFGERPLEELGIRPENIFTTPSLIPRLSFDALQVLPAGLVGSAYSTYSSGGTAQAGYEQLPEAFALAAKHARESQAPSFTVLYLPQADAAAHLEGCDAEDALAALAACDRLLAELAAELPKNSRLVATGDHGQVDVPGERTLLLEEDDPLMSTLACPPGGEKTVPFFHVKKDREEEFASLFRSRFGGHFALLAVEEAAGMRLFGPGELPAAAKRRIGNFLAIAPRPTTLNYRPPDGEFHVHRGVHAGLSPAEMTMPLVLA